MKDKRKWKLSLFLVFFIFPISIYSQEQLSSLSGLITDKKGDPLSSVTVSATNNRTSKVYSAISDSTGKFLITNIPANVTYSIDFSSVGYVKRTISGYLPKPDNVNNVMVSLEEGNDELNQIVVVGYGTIKKKLSTGATVQVKGEDLQGQSTISPLTALQSKTPGMSITSQSGAPGYGYKVNIRGLGTIGNADPLYIIDGVIGIDLNSVNPSDIETIDILKDAASAAIYGSRAANGVVLITTKKGRIGKPIINYNGFYGVQQVAKYLKVLDAQQYMAIQNESLKNAGIAETDFSKLVPNYVWEKLQSGWKGTDWQREFTNNNAPTQSHTVGVSGGTPQSVYSLGVSYSSQEGVLGKPVTAKYERYTARLNSTYDIIKGEDFTKLKIGENLLYVFQKSNAGGLGNSIRDFIIANPLLPVYDTEGNFHKTMPLDPDRYNPIGYAYYNNSFDTRANYDLKANAFLEYRPIRNLLFRSNYGYYYTSYTTRGYSPVFNLGDRFFRSEDVISQAQSSYPGYQWENTLSYDFKLAQKNDFMVLIGQSVEKGGFGDYISGQNMNSIFNSFDYAYLSNVKNIVSGKSSVNGGPAGINSLASFFGRVNYNYDEKYLLNASLRADGSSRFAKGNRWGVFPALALGWIITNEDFIKNKELINFFKLRASWGQNGNQSISPFQYLAQYTFGRSYFFGTDKNVWTMGAFPARLPNENITWEVSEQINFGFDSRILNNKLGIVFDYYNKKTKDWLVEAPVLASFGAAPPFINGGDIENKGFEIGLDWKDNIGKDIMYSLSGNLSSNKNKITRIANSLGIIEGAAPGFADGGTPIYRAQVGFPIGYFYGFKTNGVFQNQQQIDAYTGAKYDNTTPGDLIIEDVNDDGKITLDDRTMIGDPNPKYMFGLSGSFNYKSFDIIITTFGVAGNKIASSFHKANHYPENYPAQLLNRWHGEGTSNRYPKLAANSSPNYMYFSDIFLDDGSFLRVQNITLGYDFLKYKRVKNFASARLYFTAQNLYTFTKYYGADPEIGNAPDGWSRGIDVGKYPVPRTFLVGLNLTF